MINETLKKLLEKNEVNELILKNGFFINNGSYQRINFEYNHIANRPPILNERSLEYIQFTPDCYIIGNFDIFLKLPSIIEISNIEFDYSNFTTLVPFDVKSKISALLLAFHSGLLDDFVGEKLQITHSGCLPMQNYQFFIKSNKNQYQRLSLRNFSTYVDGVFESDNKVVLVNSELYKTEDFLLKDLFLSYRYYYERTGKEIVNIYLTFSNDIFKLYEIRFDHPEIMNVANVIKYGGYKLSEDRITFSDILHVFSNVEIVNEDKSIPFPQANDFERIINIIEFLFEAELTLDEITSIYKFVDRQSKYYTDAAMYLSLVKTNFNNDKKLFTLTETGEQIVTSKIKKKYLELVKKILEHEVFYKTIKMYIDTGQIPSKSEIVEIMRNSEVHNIRSDSTFIRRASTVQAWVKWIINLPKIYY